LIVLRFPEDEGALAETVPGYRTNSHFIRGLIFVGQTDPGDRTRPLQGPPLRDSTGISPDFAGATATPNHHEGNVELRKFDTWLSSLIA
jgi:hypothetical protein